VVQDVAGEIRFGGGRHTKHQSTPRRGMRRWVTPRGKIPQAHKSAVCLLSKKQGQPQLTLGPLGAAEIAETNSEAFSLPSRIRVWHRSERETKSPAADASQYFAP
jgi:hypothetical protein